MAPAHPGPVCTRPGHCVYRGFRLLQQPDLSWSIEPIGARPIGLGELGAGFTIPPSSLADVQALIDWRLGQAA